MYLLFIKNKITQKLSKRSKNLGCSKIFPMGVSQKGLSKSRFFLSLLTLIFNAFFFLLFIFHPVLISRKWGKGWKLGIGEKGQSSKFPSAFRLVPPPNKTSNHLTLNHLRNFSHSPASPLSCILTPHSSTTYHIHNSPALHSPLTPIPSKYTLFCLSCSVLSSCTHHPSSSSTTFPLLRPHIQ